MSPSSLLAYVAFAAAVVLALRRSRVFAIFAVVILGLPTFVTVALSPVLGDAGWLLSWLHVSAVVHFVALALWPRMRGNLYRRLVSLPGLYFVAASMLALPWAFVASFGPHPFGWWLPFVLAGFGLWQSLSGREEEVHLHLDRVDAGPLLHRFRAPGPSGAPSEALRIIQITDPHLGPFMPISRLRGICERAVARDPDLVLITGDLMTMESHDVDVVVAGLRPLQVIASKVLLCHGNHDHEAREVVAEAARRLGFRLLIDDAEIVETAHGPVQILGADFRWRNRGEALEALARRFPRRAGVARLWLLHDPGAFGDVPDAEADLVLSGHTHGGQIGLLSFGLPGTVVSAFTRIPDHGFWALGRNRLYVHRAQGHYGFPLRLGVPSEQSMLHVSFAGPATLT